MSILVFQHSDRGTAGRLGATLRDHGFAVEVRRPDVHPKGHPRGLPPDLDNVQGLVILGGPQNVTDIARYDWMQQEAALVKAAHERQLPIIGICLGAQLTAHALGGQVAAREKPMVGFYPLSLNTTGQTETMFAGIAWEHQQPFSCGQEVVQLPVGSQSLASARGCKIAAYRAGIRTYGFLFHFECDRPHLDTLMDSNKDDLCGAGLTRGEVTVQSDQCFATYARLSDRLCVNIATYALPFQKKMSA